MVPRFQQCWAHVFAVLILLMPYATLAMQLLEKVRLTTFVPSLRSGLLQKQQQQGQNRFGGQGGGGGGSGGGGGGGQGQSGPDYDYKHGGDQACCPY